MRNYLSLFLLLISSSSLKSAMSINPSHDYDWQCPSGSFAYFYHIHGGSYLMCGDIRDINVPCIDSSGETINNKGGSCFKVTACPYGCPEGFETGSETCVDGNCNNGSPSGGASGSPCGAEGDQTSSSIPRCDDCGMPRWLVSQPDLNVFIRDSPLFYQPRVGPLIKFQMVYKNFAGPTISNDNSWHNLMSVGNRWHSPWRSYIVQADNLSATNYYLIAGDGSARSYTNGVRNYQTGILLTVGSSTNFVLEYPNGKKDKYDDVVTDSTGAWVATFLTKKEDPQGRSVQKLTYQTVGNNLRLQKVEDIDNNQFTFSYTNVAGFNSNLVSEVNGPAGLKAMMSYNANGDLVWIKDAMDLATTFAYDSSNRVSKIITPYATNEFQYYYPVSGQWFALRLKQQGISETDVRNHLWTYGNTDLDPWTGAIDEHASLESYIMNHGYGTGTGFTNSPSPHFMQPTTPALPSLGAQHMRNTCYWGPRQYANFDLAIRTDLDDDDDFTIDSLTEYDFNRGHLRNWLKGRGPAATMSLAMERAPGQADDGSHASPIIWYDYAGKTDRDHEGSTTLPSYSAARVVYDPGNSANDVWAIRWLKRNDLGKVIESRETYGPETAFALRIHIYKYAANEIDIVEEYDVRSGVPYLQHEYVYDSNHQVVEHKVDPTGLNYRTIYQYSPDSTLVNVTNLATGLIINYITNASSSYVDKIVERSASGAISTNAYTYSNGQIATHTDPRGLVSSFTYDKFWRVTEKRFSHDSTGITNTYSKLDLIRTTNRMAGSVKYQRNAYGQITRATNELGKATQYQYCSCGSLDSVTDPLGKTTTYTYDNSGRLIRKTLPDASWIENTYDTLGRPYKRQDSTGVCRTNTYDLNGKLLRVDTAFGRLFERGYDDRDRVISSTDANGVTMTSTYDELGRLISRTAPSTGVETFTYSARGLIGLTNQISSSYKTTYTLDERGLRIGETNALGNKILYGYSPAKDLLSLANELTYTTTWSYSKEGQKLQKIDATSTVILTNNFDALGRLIKRWSKEKGDTVYSYDAAGSLTSVDYPSGTMDLAFQYDDNRRLTRMVDGSGTNAFTYTDSGLLLTEDGPWASDTVTYSYKANRQLASLSVSQLNAVDWMESYSYDGAGRQTNVTSQAGVFDYSYHPGLVGATPSPSKLIQRLVLGNGSKITNDFDSSARLLRTHLRQSGGTLMNSHLYQYNKANWRTNAVRNGGEYVDYTYDLDGQLQSATTRDVVGANVTNHMNEMFGYKYDAAHNLIQRTNGIPSGNHLSQTFVVDSRNQLASGSRTGTLTVGGTTAGGATSVTVKDNGNSAQAATLYFGGTFARSGITLINGNNTNIATATDSYSRTDSATNLINLPASLTFSYDQNGNLTNDGRRVFAYDAENQLTNVYEPAKWQSQFTYDAKMRLRIRREFTWSGSTWLQTNECRYIYNGNLPIQERDANNIALVTYTRGNDLSNTRSGAGGIGGLLARTDHNSLSHAYYHADGNGNITFLGNTNQQAVARYIYDPYGNLVSGAGVLSQANTYRFSSKESHENSGLNYYLYRFYDPNLQRWPNRDPIQERGGRNLYAFVKNRPISFHDAFGLFNGSSVGAWMGPRSCLPFPIMSCAEAIKNAYQGMGVQNDGRAHCIQSCLLTKACGRSVADGLGIAKETRDLTLGGVEWTLSWVLPESAERWLNDQLQGGSIDDSASDFSANNYGLDLGAEGGDCVKECEKRYGYDQHATF